MRQIRYGQARRLLGLTAVLVLAAIVAGPVRRNAAAEAVTAESSAAVTAADERLAAVTKYLASDELEGRGIDTQGLDKAADFIAKQFADLGLKTRLFDDSPFQRFSVTTGASLGEKNELEFFGPTIDGESTEAVKQVSGKDFTPLAIGGSGKFDLPLVFVGYGITAKTEGYDDYAGVDVKDKAVIVLRHEPEQDNPHSVFNGQASSEYAAFRRKVSNAYEHGARTVIFVSDKFDLRRSVSQLRARWQAAVDALAEANTKFKALKSPDDDLWRQQQERLEKLADEVKTYGQDLRNGDDPLLAFDGAGLTGEARDFPVLWCRRRPVDRVIKQALGTDARTTRARNRQRSDAAQPGARRLDRRGARSTSTARKPRSKTWPPCSKASARTATKRSSSAPITTTWAMANPARSIPAHTKSTTGPTTTPRAWRC